MIVSRETVTEFAKGMVGVPFRHRGRSKDGIDCLGLVILAGIEIGLPSSPEWDRQDYGIRGYTNDLYEWLEQWFVRLPLYKAVPGDLVLMSNPTADDIKHLAILIETGVGNKVIAHASDKLKRVVAHRMTPPMIQKVESAYRFKVLNG